jgi:hypothetical protein
MPRLSTVFAALLGAAVTLPAFADDEVTDWNQHLLESIAATMTNPPKASRAMAMMHAAVYDAVNSITGTHAPYCVSVPASGTASKEAAVAYAAHAVLRNAFPAHAITLDQQLTDALAHIGSGPAVDEGRAVGLACASTLLALRANDGSTANPPLYFGGQGVGQWRPTAPGLVPGLLPAWGNVTPFGLTSGSQFRSAPPPALNSPEYRDAYNQVKDLGRADSATRTDEQSEIAFMWAAGGGTYTPPGMWNQVAQRIAQNQSIDDNARMFALLNLAEADSAIACWDAKYAYSFWRPITAINLGDTDGNPDTVADPDWIPLLSTPPFPSYTSGHSTFSSAAAIVLAEWLGTDSYDFTMTSEGISRDFGSLWGAAEEAGMSRIYGGIHFLFDDIAALDMGSDIGHWIFDHYLQVPAPSGALALGLGALVAGRRRR